MDQSLRLLPSAIHPTNLLGFNIPGAGTVLTLLVILLTGVVATNIIGQRMVRFWEALLARIPVVKSIYYSVKQISDTLFSGWCAIPIPKRGRWLFSPVRPPRMSAP